MLATVSKPELTQVAAGSTLKIFKVTGKRGMQMPEHKSTAEAVIIVQKGSATLRIESVERRLEARKPFIIPEGKLHSLSLDDDFEAVVIMPVSSQIEFSRT
jgi:quercetin dioxygenase-like cupin family protein